MEPSYGYPKIQEVKAYIREIEEPFYEGLEAWGRSRYEGAGYTQHAFTGSWLCCEATYVMRQALKHKFGGNNRWAWMVESYILTTKDIPIKHLRVHFLDNQNQEYFIDPTFGQISVLNRIALGSAKNEASYYGVRFIPGEPNRTHTNYPQAIPFFSSIFEV